MRGQISLLVSIHDRQPEVDERLVPGCSEGDLIKSKEMVMHAVLTEDISQRTRI